jgi:hypothetical protein
MTKANFSNKNLGAGGAIIIAAWIAHQDNGALTSLNLAANNLGELVLPEGWSTKDKGEPWQKNIHVDGREQKEDPGSKPEGIIAIANAIPNMGAMTSLNLASNKLGVKGAEIIAACLPKCT